MDYLNLHVRYFSLMSAFLLFLGCPQQVSVNTPIVEQSFFVLVSMNREGRLVVTAKPSEEFVVGDGNVVGLNGLINEREGSYTDIKGMEVHISSSKLGTKEAIKVYTCYEGDIQMLVVDSTLDFTIKCDFEIGCLISSQDSVKKVCNGDSRAYEASNLIFSYRNVDSQTSEP